MKKFGTTFGARGGAGGVGGVLRPGLGSANSRPPPPMTSAAAAAAFDDDDSFGGRDVGSRGSPTRKVYKRTARISHEDSYFDDDSDDAEAAPVVAEAAGGRGDGGDEDDALDAFMVSVTRDADAAVLESKAKDEQRDASGGRAAPVAFEMIDDIELKAPPPSSRGDDADGEVAAVESDDEGRKREIVPLEDVDHSKIK
jgi:hypothetical protein